MAKTFYEVVHEAVALLRRERRVSHGAMRRELELDDALFDDVRAELIDAKQVAREDGQVLVWTEEIAASGEPTAGNSLEAYGQRRHLTVMFCDLVDSSALAGKLDPEDLRDVMDTYQRAAGRAVAPLGGHIAQYLGDGLLAYFGYPRAYGDTPVRAVRAGLAVVETVLGLNAELARRHGVELAVRIGIHTGAVVLSRVGSEEHHEYLALGETPNVAARLQQIANPNQVLISNTTRRLVGGFFQFEDLGPRQLRGVAEPIEVARVVGVDAAETRFDVALAGRLTPFVGRIDAFATLTKAWEETTAGEAGTVLIVGESGVGKSRLLETFAEKLPSEARRLRCRCSPYHRNTAWYPLIDMLGRLVGFSPRDTAEEKRSSFEAALPGLALDSEESVPLLAALLSVSLPEGARHRALALSPQERRLRTLDMLRGMLTRLAAAGPVCLAVEDVHWIDPSSAEFFGRLAIPGVLQLMTARSRADLSFTQDLLPDTIELGRLDADDARRLLEDFLGGKCLPEKLTRQLLEKTDGVPLFIEEQAKLLLESGLLADRGDRYELSRSLREMPIAETIQDSVQARLDGLGSDGLTVAQLGATLGRAFPYDLLEAVAPFGGTQLHNALAQLLESGLLFQRGPTAHPTYVFKHALIQEVAYGSLLRLTRRRYHARAAKALIQSFPEIERAQPELIAHHCAGAGDRSGALRYYERAGAAAAGKWAIVEAIDHLQRALEHLAGEPDGPERRLTELRLRLALGPPLMSVRGYAAREVEETYRRVRQLCLSEGVQAQLVPALVGVWQYEMVGGNLPEARELAAELLTLAEKSQDTTLLLIARRALGTTVFLQGELDPAIAFTRSGWESYDIERHGRLAFELGNDPGVAHGVYLAWALWQRGWPDQARRQASASLELAERIDHPMSVAFSSCYAAIVYNLCGDFVEARRLGEDAIGIAEAHGLQLWRALAGIQTGRARVGLGECREGLAQLVEGIAGWFQTGARAGTTFFYALQAEAELAVGDLEAAERSLGEAEVMTFKNDEHCYEPELLRIRGEITRLRGEEDAASRLYERGLALARKQLAKSWELRLTQSVATQLAAHGQAARAASLLEQCLGWFSEGADTRDHVQSRCLLAELRA